MCHVCCPALQARLAELSSENRSMRNRERAVERRKRDSEIARSNGRAEHRRERERERERDEGGEEEEGDKEEEEKSYTHDKLEAHEPDKTKGLLLRFLQGIQPVSYLYWES